MLVYSLKTNSQKAENEGSKLHFVFKSLPSGAKIVLVRESVKSSDLDGYTFTDGCFWKKKPNQNQQTKKKPNQTTC